MALQPLFRTQVLAERQTKWLGSVLLAPRFSYRVFTLFAVASTTLLSALLFFAHYTRTARVHGWLVPQEGLVQVYAPQAGVVTEIYVKEGIEVQRNDPLFVLSAELQSSTLGATQKEVARRLNSRKDSLLAARQQLEQLAVQQINSLSARIATLQSEDQQLSREIALQKSRLHLSRKTESRQHRLHRGGYISDQNLQLAREASLDQAARLGDLERARIVNHRDSLTLQGMLKDLPLTSQSEIANLDRSVSTVEQELAETEAKREIVIPSPESGTVTAIQIARGGRPNTNVPLLSLIPSGSLLEAHLFCPSRAMGFLKSGQRVLLRYQAYPYQKFGHYEGVVASISRSAVNPSELPSQLAGLTSLYGGSEPIYRITVRLAVQSVTAYGQKVRLQPGMQLEADVLLERRRLYEWVLDPLYTITGRWKA